MILKTADARGDEPVHLYREGNILCGAPFPKRESSTLYDITCEECRTLWEVTHTLRFEEGLLARASAMFCERASAMFCEHANEVPMGCPCPRDCFCKSNTCRGS